MFATKTDTARRLGLDTISDLTARWSRARARRREPLQDEQWAFAEGSVLDLPGAWASRRARARSSPIVDSGTKLDHPDLAPNIWANFREVPGNGADDDGNGYVDDVYGVDLTSTSAAQNLSDGHGHGTHVAGIVAAAANRRGVVGVAPRAKIMTVRVLDDTGAGTTGAVAEGIRYAAANGARVINASIQGDEPDPRHGGRDRRGRSGQRARRGLRRQQRARHRRQARPTRRRSRRRTSSASPRPRPTRARTSTATRTTAGSRSASPRPAGRSWRRPTTAATAASPARRWRRRSSPAWRR